MVLDCIDSSALHSSYIVFRVTLLYYTGTFKDTLSWVLDDYEWSFLSMHVHICDVSAYFFFYFGQQLSFSYFVEIL